MNKQSYNPLITERKYTSYRFSPAQAQAHADADAQPIIDSPVKTQHCGINSRPAWKPMYVV